MSTVTPVDSVRLDKWLWAARFYKTRSLASAAVDGGHIHVNGERAKPSRKLRLNDEIRVRKGAGLEIIVWVRLLAAQRGPASSAQQLYEETPASQAARDLYAAQRRALRGANPLPSARPTKRDRRHIIRFTQK